jgi:hypothetical protein
MTLLQVIVYRCSASLLFMISISLDFLNVGSFLPLNGASLLTTFHRDNLQIKTTPVLETVYSIPAGDAAGSKRPTIALTTVFQPQSHVSRTYVEYACLRFR